MHSTIISSLISFSICKIFDLNVFFLFVKDWLENWIFHRNSKAMKHLAPSFLGDKCVNKHVVKRVRKKENGRNASVGARSEPAPRGHLERDNKPSIRRGCLQLWLVQQQEQSRNSARTRWYRVAPLRARHDDRRSNLIKGLPTPP